MAKKSRGTKPKLSMKSLTKGPTPIIIALLVIVGSFLAIWLVGSSLGLWTILQPTTPTTTEFSISVIDGSTQKTLPNSDFNFTLYGTNDVNDWLDYEVIETGDSLSDITSADFEGEDNEFDNYVIRYNGSVDHSDSLYGEDYDWGARAYYERWDILIPNDTNVLTAYQTPSDADFVIVNSESFAYINVTAVNITTATNFTLIAGTNATQIDAKYMKGNNYQNEVDDYVFFQIQANTTLSLSDLSMAGATKIRVNTTTVSFGIAMLGPTPQSFQVEWDNDAADIEIVSISMLWVETELASY